MIFASRSCIKNLLKSSVLAGKLSDVEINHWSSIFSITDFPFLFENSMYAICGKTSLNVGNNNSDDELEDDVLPSKNKPRAITKKPNESKSKIFKFFINIIC